MSVWCQVKWIGSNIVERVNWERTHLKITLKWIGFKWCKHVGLHHFCSSSLNLFRILLQANISLCANVSCNADPVFCLQFIQVTMSIWKGQDSTSGTQMFSYICTFSHCCTNQIYMQNSFYHDLFFFLSSPYCNRVTHNMISLYH